MSTSNWNVAYTIVAGADLSAAQYKAVNPTGVLATSATNGCGILQNKPLSGEHATIVFLGVTKAYMVHSVGVGAFLGFSNATSGGLGILTTSGFAYGRSLTGADSGYLASVYLFGAPVNLKEEGLSQVTATTNAFSGTGAVGKFATYSGTLPLVSTDNVAGVLLTSAVSGAVATVKQFGRASVLIVASYGVGLRVGPSGVTSGFATTITSGGTAYGSIAVAANSGQLAGVDLYGGPSYISL